MTVETKTQNPRTDQELFELPLSERFSAWTTRINGLERARMDLFKEGEHALADGLQKLGLDANRIGTQLTRDDVFKTQVIRQPLTIPNRNSGYGFDNRLPDEFIGLLDSLHLGEYSFKTPANLWMEIAKIRFDELTLGATIGDEKFELQMVHNRESSYYLNPRRADNGIVEFRGNYTRYFERNIDRFKDLNRADANTKLGIALAFVKVVSDLKSP